MSETAKRGKPKKEPDRLEELNQQINAVPNADDDPKKQLLVPKCRDLFFDALGNWIPSDFKVMWGGRAGLKCLEVGTKVIMADGSLRAVEDVVVGDQVMGPDSLPRNVLSVSRGQDHMYQVRQTNGMDYRVNASHILSLKKSKTCTKEKGKKLKSGNFKSPLGRYPSWPDVTNISVTAFAEQSAKWKDRFCGYHAGVIAFPKQEVSIDPYFLGVWLGDGTSREMRLTSADPEIVNAWREVVEAHGMQMSVNDLQKTAKTYGCKLQGTRTNSLWRKFIAYGLPNNKHIPQDYISNNETTRLQLLAGLLDTDGRFVPHKNYVISQTNERLAKQIKYLADTLGFRTDIVKYVTTCSNAKNGPVKGVAWRVYIGGDIWRIPCRVERKKALAENFNKRTDWLLSRVSVEYIGIGEIAGFTIDGDHLFLLEDGTVTHNTWTVTRVLVLLAATRKIRVLCARELMNSIRESTHNGLVEQIELLGLERFFDIQLYSIRSMAGSEFIFEGVKNDPRKIKSLNAVDICFLEEAENVSSDSWEIVIPTILRKAGAEIWVVFNPHLESDPTSQMFLKNPPPNSRIIETNWRDNPWLDEKLKRQMAHLAKVDPDAYQHVYEGKFRSSTNAQVLAGKYVIEEFTPSFDFDGPLQGCDFGFSVDPSVLIRMWICGNDLFIEYEAYGIGVDIDKLPELFSTIPMADKYVTRCDSSRPETVSYLQRAGFPKMVSVEKWANSVVEGVAFLRSFERIVIHPRCVHAIEEAKKWEYKVERLTRDVLPDLKPGWDHVWDAARYGLQPLIKQGGDWGFIGA